MLTLTAHQPQYLPGLRLFDKIARADMFVYLDTVPMESSGFENRNKIKTAKGWQWLTVPVLRKDYQTRPIDTIKIKGQQWVDKHWKSIKLAYKKAPFWDWLVEDTELFYFLEPPPCYTNELALLNYAILIELVEILGIEIKLDSATNHNFVGNKSDLILDMCKKLGATKYIFGAKGRGYAKVEDFEREGIEVEFQDYQHPVYPQLHGEFLPNMSVVDLLMNCGPKSLEVLTCGNLKK